MSPLKGEVGDILTPFKFSAIFEWNISQICSVKTSVWYTIKHQQNLKKRMNLIKKNANHMPNKKFLNYVKIKNFCSTKEIMDKVMGQITEWQVILQSLKLIRD